MEIITFYGMIGSAIIFLFLSSVISIKRKDYLVPESEDSTDFIVWTQDLYSYFGLYCTMLAVTVTVFILENDFICNNGFSLKPGMTTLISVHVL